MATGALAFVLGTEMKEVHGCGVSMMITGVNVSEVFGMTWLRLAIMVRRLVRAAEG